MKMIKMIIFIVIERLKEEMKHIKIDTRDSRQNDTHNCDTNDMLKHAEQSLPQGIQNYLKV